MFAKGKKIFVILLSVCSLLLFANIFSSLNKNFDNGNDKSYKLYSSSILHKTTIYEDVYNQSIVVYNNKFYTFYTSTDNKGFVEVRNVKTDYVYNSMEIEIGHGNGACVSNIWRDKSDDTPLIFVSHCTNDNKVSALYFINNVAYLYKTYSFSSDNSGFQASIVFDNINNIAYTLGTAKGYKGYSENANSVIGVYDISKEILLDNGTYTFELIDSYEIEEIPFKQDVDFYDNKIWILTCDVNTELTKAVYGISPSSKRIEVVIDEFITDKIGKKHGEGICFYKNNLYLNSYLGYTFKYKFYK